MGFPYGKAPLAILLMAVLTGVLLLASVVQSETREEPDLVFATFTKEHAAAYRPAIAEFEKKHGVTIQLQVVDQKALQSRLAAAMQAGAETPDMVELLEGTMGTFVKGPIEDVGFVDLTDKVNENNLLDRVVASRFPQWSSRGHIFALPHDVHPTLLAYRQDVVDELGIDVSKLKTWDDFARIAREKVVKDFDEDGVIDHYMMDLPINSGDIVRMMLLQRGGGMFDEQGQVTFDSEEAVDVIEWYVKAAWNGGGGGEEKISFPAGWGQNLAKAMQDGLIVFITTPDWRTAQFQMDMPSLAGKLRVMPLPAWEEGGIRTSTWGATGLAITKQAKERGKFDLAWELAMHLYYDAEQLGPRFADTNILPPLKAAWDQPEFEAPHPFFGGQRIGRLYANLAPDVPGDNSSPYLQQATAKLLEAVTRSAAYYEAHGEEGLRDVIRQNLKDAADQVRTRINRNVFLAQGSEEEAQ